MQEKENAAFEAFFHSGKIADYLYYIDLLGRPPAALGRTETEGDSAYQNRCPGAAPDAD